VIVIFAFLLSFRGDAKSCGHVDRHSDCAQDLNKCVDLYKIYTPEFFPKFKLVTGVELKDAEVDDMALYFWCSRNQPSDFDLVVRFQADCEKGGLEIPCGRECYPSDYQSSSPMFDGTVQLTMEDLVMIGLVVMSFTLIVVFVVNCKRQKYLKEEI